MNKFLVYINPNKVEITNKSYYLTPGMKRFIGKIILVEKINDRTYRQKEKHNGHVWLWHSETCMKIDKKLAKILYDCDNNCHLSD